MALPLLVKSSKPPIEEGLFMTKIATVMSALILATASSVLVTAHCSPQGFANQAATPNTVAQVLSSAQDDQRVTLTGRLTNYLGQERYEFADSTGYMVVELDDDQNWSHVSKDQLITIFGKVDRDFSDVEIDVKEARVAL